MYQNSGGGKTYIPLEVEARIINCSTPKFCKSVSSKYARLNAQELCNDLLSNHGRKISRGTVQKIADGIGSIAQAKENTWSYSAPVQDSAIDTVVCSLDGAYLNTVDDGWQETMVGSISLYDCDGQRQHSIYFGVSPEYGKESFPQRYEQELSHVKRMHPDSLYVGIADGAKDNWTFLKQQTQSQLLDFFHACEYLNKVAFAAFPEKTGKPDRQRWTKERCHQLKHDPGAPTAILEEITGFKRKRKLSASVREDLNSAITYFTNHIDPNGLRQSRPAGPAYRFRCCGGRLQNIGQTTILSFRHALERIWNQNRIKFTCAGSDRHSMGSVLGKA